MFNLTCGFVTIIFSDCCNNILNSTLMLCFEISQVIRTSVETGSGRPGHIFSGSSGSDPVYNLSGSDPDWIT